MTFNICKCGNCFEGNGVFCVICGRRADASIAIPEKYSNLGKIEYLHTHSTGHVFRISGKREYALKLRNTGRRKSHHEEMIVEALRGCSGVVSVEDVCYDGAGGLWLLEEYLEPFSGYLENKRITAGKALELLMDLCTDLIECRERGVLHLDIKPENLFVDAEGRLKLGDFSTSLFISDVERSMKHRGTLAYMAPEVYRGVSCGERSDVYSVSILAYMMFNRAKLPFADECDSTLATYKRLAGTYIPDVDCRNGQIAHIFMEHMRSGWEFDPDKRIADFDRLLRTFEMILRDIRNVGLQDFVLLSGCNDTEDCDINSGPTEDVGFLDFQFEGAGEPGTIDDGFITCNSCGSRLPGTQKFCRICGRPLRDVPTVDAGAIAPPPTDVKERMGEPRFLASRPSAFPTSRPEPEKRTGIFDKLRRYVTDAGSKAKAGKSKRIIAEPYVPETSDEIFTSAKLPPEPVPAAEISKVKFSAIAPEKLERGKYSIIDLIMYEDAFRSVVETVMAEHRETVRETRSGVVKVKDESTITVRLDSPDAQITGGEERQCWYGEYLRFSFPVMLPEDYARQQALFTATVYINDIVATRLSFIAECSASAAQNLVIERHDILSAFVSYASQDRGQVAAVVQGMKKARPDMDIFFDVESLRSGDYWEQRLYSEIDKRDMLFLCWSRSAMNSVYVDREWRYAYENKGIDSIEPIPIEDPNICPPPKELKDKHFNDKMLFVINAEKYARQ